MTNRTKTILFSLASAFAGLIIGGLIGAYGMANISARLYADTLELANVVNLKKDIGLLKLLRDGKTDKAIDRLELSLNGDVLALGLNQNIASGTHDRVKESIDMARDYRNKFPRRSSGTELDNTVNSILSKQYK